MRTVLLLALVACKQDPESTPAPLPPLDLSETLAPDQARAGQITDEAALFGGISAEGRAGDFKIYNSRVQFVIQGPRVGNYYVAEGGTVIDADLVRPDGVLGRDLLDEWGTMLGIGRVVSPTRIEVVDDGRDGGAAVVRVTGEDVPLALIEGALELPGFVSDLGLEVVTEYVLAPDDPFLEVRTTITAADDDATAPVGDLMMGAPEVAERWATGRGLGPEDGAPRLLTGYLGSRNDVAVAIVAGPGATISSKGAEVLAEIADLVVGLGEPHTLAEGESVTVTRYYGVGPDLATLTDAALARHGTPAETLSGVVEAPDGPVAGARVNVLVDDDPFTVAFTDAEGRWSADVPAGSATSVVVDGRGPGLFTDLPDGAAPYSPYAAAPVREAVLDALANGAVPVPQARGRGVGELGVPVELTLQSDGPFTAWLTLRDDPPVDERVVQPRAGAGRTVAAWSHDGEITVTVEPGTYDLVAHRGMVHAAFSAELVVDGPQTVELPIARAFDHPGWVFADPHSHASPSPDGDIPMEDRLVVTAASGVEVHFGTDHDHVADYRPLLGALGLGDTLQSVVADEVSPPLRGHLNIYPIEPDPSLPNHGAFSWWTQIPSSTTEITDALRARHGDDFVLQLNHPWSAGLADYADWSPGVIGDPNRWTEDFQAVEVVNGGATDGLAFYLDLVNRGYDVTPVGVSDSHGYFDGELGVNGTFFALDGAAEDGISAAVAAGRAIVSRGAFLDLSIAPGAVLTAPDELTVVARTPPWAAIDRLELYRDGQLVETVDGDEATFQLDAPSDATFLVIAAGDQPMAPVSTHTPWATHAAIKLDVDGDGWEPPLPPLVME